MGSPFYAQAGSGLILHDVAALISRANDPSIPSSDRHVAALAACRWLEDLEVSLAAEGCLPATVPPRALAAIEPKKPTEYRALSSDFAGSCIACGRPYEVGAWIVWARGIGAMHARCGIPKSPHEAT